MTSKERVRASINHQQSDRVPVDLGGTFVTGLHCSVVAALRERFGLEKKPVKVHEPYQMLGYVDEDLKRVLGVDVEGVIPNNTLFGIPSEGWKNWKTPWGQEVLVGSQFNTTTGSDGSVYMYPEGDTTVPPSGHMPAGGYFFDAIVPQEPVNDDTLNVEDNLEEFKPLDAPNLRRIVEGVNAAGKTGRAVLVCMPGTGLGDIAAVPAPFLKHPKGIRDIEEWYYSTSARQDYVEGIFAKQVKIALNNLATINKACGDLVDVAVLCGTDFGTQNSQFCSVNTFRKLWMPYYKMMNDWIHANTKWKTFKHSCGAVNVFIDSFIEAGFDILNPVQCSATGMEAEGLKERFGRRITFWGGGIDTQHIMPFGTPQQVRQQVTERLKTFSVDGGYIFNAIHNIQARTPVENVLAMVEAVKEFNDRRSGG